MKRLLTLAAAAAVLSIGMPAMAQDAGKRIPVATQDADHDARRALIHRYFVAIQFEKLMNGVLESTLESMLSDPSIPADKREVVMEVVLETFRASMPAYQEAVIDLYADEFTVEELQGMVDFYESPIGRSLTAKSVMLSQRSNELYAQFMPVWQADIQRRLCARLSCDATGALAPTAKR